MSGEDDGVVYRTDGGGWLAEQLTWEFAHDPTMRCPVCEDGPVNAEELLKHGWASCQQCGAEYSASVTLEQEGSA